MFVRCFDAALAAFLIALSLPLLALRSILARRKRTQRAQIEIHALQAEEFSFEHAVEAYEALIDATFAQRRA